jgi:hypothetical protein
MSMNVVTLLLEEFVTGIGKEHFLLLEQLLELGVVRLECFQYRLLVKISLFKII